MVDVMKLGWRGLGQVKEQTTPYKLSLLVLIEEYLLNTRKTPFEREVYSEAEERNMLILILELVQSVDLKLKELMQRLDGAAKSTLKENLRLRLRDLCIDGVSAIMDMMHTIPRNLIIEQDHRPPMLHRSSVIGLFVRRMVLSFDRLSFGQVTQLHRQYREFYECWSSLEKDEHETSQLGDTSISIIEIMDKINRDDDSIIPKGESGPEPISKYSQRQAELFIAQQASILQHNELEALSPKQLQQRISDLLTGNPDLAEAHFLSYLNNLRVMEYCGAMDSLHHYFDRKQLQGPEVKGQTEEDCIISRGLRYAALNMAALHYKFGHRCEALAAVREAIRMAHDTGDDICLQHALSWLEILGGQDLSQKGHTLDKLVTKTGELDLPYLTSQGVQALAKHNALSACVPSDVFKFLFKSDIKNCQHSQSDLMCVSYAQKAALWQVYGKREMSNMSCQLMLHLSSSDHGVYHNDEAECLALALIAKMFAQQGEYDSAQNVLDSAKQRFPAHTENAQIWMIHEQQILFTKSLYQCNYTAAYQHALNVAPADFFTANYSWCLLLKEKGELSTASEQLQLLLDLCKDETSVGISERASRHYIQAQLLLLQAELYYSGGNLTQAIDPLLSCLTLCKQHYFSYLTAITTAHLAYVQYNLGMPSKAIELLEDEMVPILCDGGLYDRARVTYLWVKCKVAVVSKQQDRSDKVAEIMNCVTMLNRVIDWFKQVQANLRVKDVYYYQAKLYNELGYNTERNKCALEFRRLDEHYPTFHQSNVLVL